MQQPTNPESEKVPSQVGAVLSLTRTPSHTVSHISFHLPSSSQRRRPSTHPVLTPDFPNTWVTWESPSSLQGVPHCYKALSNGLSLVHHTLNWCFEPIAHCTMSLFLSAAPIFFLSWWMGDAVVKVGLSLFCKALVHSQLYSKTVVFKFISQLYFETVFCNCISQLTSNHFCFLQADGSLMQ